MHEGSPSSNNNIINFHTYYGNTNLFAAGNIIIIIVGATGSPGSNGNTGTSITAL